MKVISCAGFGCTGSSIITDFFREVSNVYSVGGNGLEFFLLHEPDGIKDLETALVEGHRFKADLAIKRFMRLVNNLYYHNPSGPNYKDFFNGKFLEITNEYLASLNIISWERGWWHRIFEDNDNKLHRLIKKFRFQSYAKKAYHLYEPDSWKPTYTGYKKEYYAHIDRGQFEQKTKAYLSRLFSEIDTDAEYLLFDQLFPPSNAGEYTNYFDSVKVFIVDRDPRDLYFANKVFWGCGFIPMDSAAIFTEWYRNTREATKITPNVCLVSFEDFIFKTDETLRFAMDFVGIPYSYQNNPIQMQYSSSNPSSYSRRFSSFLCNGLKYLLPDHVFLLQLTSQLIQLIII